MWSERKKRQQNNSIVGVYIFPPPRTRLGRLSTRTKLGVFGVSSTSPLCRSNALKVCSTSLANRAIVLVVASSAAPPPSPPSSRRKGNAKAPFGNSIALKAANRTTNTKPFTRKKKRARGEGNHKSDDDARVVATKTRMMSMCVCIYICVCLLFVTTDGACQTDLGCDDKSRASKVSIRARRRGREKEEAEKGKRRTESQEALVVAFLKGSNAFDLMSPRDVRRSTRDQTTGQCEHRAKREGSYF